MATDNEEDVARSRGMRWEMAEEGKKENVKQGIRIKSGILIFVLLIHVTVLDKKYMCTYANDCLKDNKKKEKA